MTYAVDAARHLTLGTSVGSGGLLAVGISAPLAAVGNVVAALGIRLPKPHPHPNATPSTGKLQEAGRTPRAPVPRFCTAGIAWAVRKRGGTDAMGYPAARVVGTP
jgi:hypothetical protein